MNALFKVAVANLIGTAILLLGGTLSDAGEAQTRNFDARSTRAVPYTLAGDEGRRLAVAQLKVRIPELRVEFDRITGTVRWIHNPNGAVAKATSSGADRSDEFLPGVMESFLDKNAVVFGHGSDLLRQARVVIDHTSTQGGRTMVWEQDFEGIPVFEGRLAAHVTSNGDLISVSSYVQPHPSEAAGAGVPGWSEILKNVPVSATEAVAKALQAVGIDPSNLAITPAATSAAPTPMQEQVFELPGFSRPAEMSLVWLPVDSRRMLLCWRAIVVNQSGHLFQVLIDAQNGEVLLRHSWTFGLSNATYRVFGKNSPTPFSPGYSTPDSTPPPLEGTPPHYSRTNLTLAARSTNASPYGWISDGETRTIGNNADARLDLTNSLPAYNAAVSPPRPNRADRVFDYPLNLTQSPDTTNNQNAAVVNAFYWVNWMHDELYDLGFTESLGAR